MFSVVVVLSAHLSRVVRAAACARRLLLLRGEYERRRRRRRMMTPRGKARLQSPQFSRAGLRLREEEREWRRFRAGKGAICYPKGIITSTCQWGVGLLICRCECTARGPLLSACKLHPWIHIHCRSIDPGGSREQQQQQRAHLNTPFPAGRNLIKGCTNSIPRRIT